MDKINYTINYVMLNFKRVKFKVAKRNNLDKPQGITV